MKKMITLSAALMFFVAAFAQYNAGNQRNNDYNKDRDYSYNERSYKKDRDHDNDRYNFNTRERDKQIAAINREYDRKIAAVDHRWFMSRSKKEAIICSLQNQRKNEIRMVYEQFNRRSNRHDDHDSGRY